MKKTLSILLAALLIAGLLAGCGDSGSGATTSSGAASSGGSAEPATIDMDEAPYEVSIQFVGLFEENNNIANVEAALSAITKEKINVTVDIVPVFIGNLPTTTSLGVAGDEKLDIVAVGLTSPMDNMVSQELLLPLDDLLASRGQAALAVTEHVSAAQKMNGITYAVSGYPYAAMSGSFVYNKTMADEFGIDMHDGMTSEELTEAARICKEHGVYFTSYPNSSQLNYKFQNGGDYFGTSGAFGGILDPANSTTIVNVFDSEEFRSFWRQNKLWFDEGLTPPDQLTDTTSVQEYFANQHLFGTATAYTTNQMATWTNPNFETGIVRTSEPSVSTAGAREFMLGIAANCKRPDKAMDLINLIYADADVANLLMYGVEGTDYVAVEGTENVITRAGTANADNNSYYAGFVHYGDPTMLKIVAPLTDSYPEDTRAFENEAKMSLTFGYDFDGSAFSAEAGAIGTILEQKLPALNAGAVADVDAAVDELVAALNAAGMQDCIDANQKALDAWLEANK
ncbi:MAG: extracellular solute-binding protein [Oscillospiraceae bacterium]|nr:extracellular solute-binding protein [Oscillospiraceae bacterium]